MKSHGCDLFVVKIRRGPKQPQGRKGEEGEEEEEEAGGWNGFGDSKPCHLCVRWLQRCGVHRVYYSVDSGDSAFSSSSSPRRLPYRMQKVGELHLEQRSSGGSGSCSSSASASPGRGSNYFCTKGERKMASKGVRLFKNF
ncbi:hypothetical protein QOT17_004732 [Balamuthia mandrillaris]